MTNSKGKSRLHYAICDPPLNYVIFVMCANFSRWQDSFSARPHKNYFLSALIICITVFYSDCLERNPECSEFPHKNPSLYNWPISDFGGYKGRSGMETTPSFDSLLMFSIDAQYTCQISSPNRLNSISYFPSVHNCGHTNLAARRAILEWKWHHH